MRTDMFLFFKNVYLINKTSYGQVKPLSNEHPWFIFNQLLFLK